MNERASAERRAKESRSERRVLGVILSRVFLGGGERARQRDRGESEGSAGREEKRQGGLGNERSAARVRLIDEFRLEIFAAPYAPNRRA